MSNYFYDCEFLEGTQKKKFWWGNTVPTIDLISIGIVSEDGREFYAISKDFNLKEAWNRFDLKRDQVSGDMRNKFPNGITKKVYWIRENVLMPIFFELAEREFHNIHFKDEWTYEGKVVDLEVFKSNKVWTSNFTWFKKLINKYGKTNKQISDEIIYFTEPIHRYYSLPNGEDRFTKGMVSRSVSILSEIEVNRYALKFHYPDTNPVFYGYYSSYDHVALCWLFGKMIDLPKGFPMYTIDLKQELDRVVINKEKEYFRKLECDICTHNVLEYLERTGEALELNFRLKLIKEKDKNYPKPTNEHNSLADARFNFELYKFLNG